MADKKKILIIDDEEDFCFFVRKNLINSQKFDAIIATSGKSGLALARSEKPDLILLDLMMPGMGGEAVYEALRASPDTGNIPVIFLTALVTREDTGKEGLKKIGNSWFIAKPVRTRALIAAISEVLKNPD